MAFALQDPTVKRVVAMATDAAGGLAPVPNYKAKIDMAALIAQEEAKQDARIDGEFAVDALRLTPMPDGKGVGIVSEHYELLTTPRRLNPHAEYQLAVRMGVPSGFFEKSSADLKMRIVNEHGGIWKPQDGIFPAPPVVTIEHDPADDAKPKKEPKPKNVLLRLDYDGQVRAMLSPGYAFCENLDLLKATLKLMQNDGATAAYLSLGDVMFHGRILFPDHAQTLGKGDKLVPGAQVRNSEVGMSSSVWSPAMFRVRCWNGLISVTDAGGEGILQRHTGKGAADAFAKLEDAMQKIIEGQPKLMERLALASETKVNDGIDYLESAVRWGLPKGMIPAALEAATEAKAETVYDYINAVTAVAQGHDLDARIAIERAAGKMLSGLKN